MWLSFHLEHRYSKLRVPLEDFTFDEYGVPPLSFLITCVWSWFYLILEWLLQLLSWDCLLGKLFSRLLLWDSVCLCPWGGFPVCIKKKNPAYVASLLVYIFLLGNWVHWYDGKVIVASCYFCCWDSVLAAFF